MAAHAAAEGEDPVHVEAHPGQAGLHDPRHAGEVGDLAPVAPGVQRQPATHPARAHDREVAAARQVAPELGIALGPDAPAVRRDHER